MLTKILKCRTTQAGGLLVIIAAIAASIGSAGGNGPQANKLEGSWIGKVPNSPIMWSYAMSPDPSGKSAAVSGSIQVPMGPSLVVPNLFPDLEYYSPLVGQVQMTGPDTLEASAVYYGMKKGFPFNQVVFIGRNDVQGRFTGPGQCVFTNHLVFYAPSADADGDGLPDPGQAPVLCLPGTISIETRVPIFAPCTP